MISKSFKALNEIGTPTAEDMALINGFALKKLTPQEVFCFSVILCDNDIDRDFERFDEEALKALEKLFVGKTGILNHSMKSEDQSCRTYKTELITDNSKETSDGKPYVYLKAWCYTVRSEKNDSLIRDIESGIKKEVSISCASKGRICSICGEKNCSHIAGRNYDGKVCYKTITDICDAYEWSFVAVPAQRKAGVTKSFKKEKSMENILKSIKENKPLTLEGDELRGLSDYIENLERKSADGEKYRAELCAKTKMSFSLAIPEISEECVDGILKNLSTENLEALSKAMAKKAAGVVPVASQLYVEEGKNDNSNSEFKI